MQRLRGLEALRLVPPAGLCHGQQPRDTTGSPPERGMGAHAVWSGHVSAPDPRLALIKAWVFFALESRDPTVSGSDPPWGVRDLSQGSVLYLWRSWTSPGGPGCACRGPAFSRGGPDPLSPPWSISSLLAMWRPRSRPRGGVGRCSKCNVSLYFDE
jgi:hypothetical protein